MVTGQVFIPAGADAMTQVTAVQKASHHGHRGTITLTPQWVNDANGNHVPLAQAGATFDGRGNGGAAGAATVAASVFFLVPGLFVHNFFKGGDITVTPQSIFSAQTAADATLSGAK